MKNQIIFKQQDWDKLNKSLYETNELESGLYGFYKESTTASSHKILVNDILIPKIGDYHRRTASYVAFKTEFTVQALRHCMKNRCHLLDIHTHPWSTEVNFSSIDDNEAIHTKIPYLKQYVKNVKISFIVLGKNSQIAKARMWEAHPDRLESIYKIVIL